LPILMTAIVIAVALRSSPPQAEAPLPAAAVTMLLTFGEKATAAERWDGSATVTGGRLLSIEGRHFSSGDEVNPTGSWKCVTRRDEVPLWSDFHYTEMGPGTTPPVRYYPVGAYLTIDNATARVAVFTAQGNFELSLADLAAEPKTMLNGRATARLVPTP